MKSRAIVIGAGIVGLAMARALAKSGREVEVFDRSSFPVGASIRNFGMVWPIGQTSGIMYERAMLSRSIWTEISNACGLWHDPVGSLHLAYSDLEYEVLQSYYEAIRAERNYQLLDARQAALSSSSVVTSGLKGGVLSPDEMIVDSPTALKAIPQYLEEQMGVKFHWNTFINAVETGKVHFGKQELDADEIFVCNGPDFENLYPEVFQSIPITKCKLQMMRMGVQPNGWRMGPSLCGGLSLLHYSGFKVAGGPLLELKQYVESNMPDYVKWGIHVMVSQNQAGELIIGDSHEYGPTHDPFERSFINNLILDYLKTFARFPDENITVNWHGIYPKMMDGRTEFVHHPETGVTIVNGLGGSGMTLSFGLTDQIVNGIYKY